MKAKKCLCFTTLLVAALLTASIAGAETAESGEKKGINFEDIN